MLPRPRKPFDPAVGGFPRHFTSLSAPLGPLNPASDPFVSTTTGTSTTSTTGTGTGTGTTLSPTAPGFVPRSATLPSRNDDGGSPLSMSMAINDAGTGRAQGRRRDGSGSGRDGLGLTFGLGVELDVDLGLRLSLDNEDDVAGSANGAGSRRGSFKTIPNPRPWLHASLGPSAPPLPPPPPRTTSLEMTSPAKTAFEDAESDERVFVIENLPADINYYALASLFDRTAFPSLQPPILDCLPTRGTIYVRFTDLRDARAARKKFAENGGSSGSGKAWRVREVKGEEMGAVKARMDMEGRDGGKEGEGSWDGRVRIRVYAKEEKKGEKQGQGQPQGQPLSPPASDAPQQGQARQQQGSPTSPSSSHHDCSTTTASAETTTPPTPATAFPSPDATLGNDAKQKESGEGRDTRVLSHNLKSILESFGDVYRFRCLPVEAATGEEKAKGLLLEILIEFFDTRGAEACVRGLGRGKGKGSFDDCYLEVDHYRPETPDSKTSPTAIPSTTPESLISRSANAAAAFQSVASPSRRLSIAGPLSTSAPSNLTVGMPVTTGTGAGMSSNMSFGSSMQMQMPPPTSLSPTNHRLQDQSSSAFLPQGTGSGAMTTWQRGHHRAENSTSSTSSSGASGGSTSLAPSMRRLSTGSTFSNPVLAINSGRGYTGKLDSSIAERSCEQILELSPTGRTRVPVGSNDAIAWYGQGHGYGSPTKLGHADTATSTLGGSAGMSVGAGAFDSSLGLGEQAFASIGTSSTFNPNAMTFSSGARNGGDGGANAGNAMGMAMRQGTAMSTTPSAFSALSGATWGSSPRRDSFSNSMALSLSGMNQTGAGPDQSAGNYNGNGNGNGNASGTGTSMHIPNSTLTAMRYRDMAMNATMNMGSGPVPGHAACGGCSGACQQQQQHQCLHNSGRMAGQGNSHTRNSSGSNNQNYVDIEKIKRGQDVRTTIMLRNIPNKIDQAMLKDIVDETSFGKYDFMYLRIDFANNCNVGYAFINFEDPIDIVDFANARAGKTWNCFNSDKVAEISYATIQGKDCLVQKFRNSSVMLEHPSFRPKIFHTGTGPLASTEDAFPPPDNPSKMRRSVENAEHVGLFAPRVGQQFRDEQRRRRSQFDRGTTAAERETFAATNYTTTNLTTGNGSVSGSTSNGGVPLSMNGMSSGVPMNMNMNLNMGYNGTSNNHGCPWTPHSYHSHSQSQGAIQQPQHQLQQHHGSSSGPSSPSSSQMTSFSPHHRRSTLTSGNMASIAEMQVGPGPDCMGSGGNGGNMGFMPQGNSGSPHVLYGAGAGSGDAKLSMSPTLMSPSAKTMGTGNGVGLGNGGMSDMWVDRW